MNRKMNDSTLYEEGENGISANRYYGTFYGHPVRDLEVLLERLRQDQQRTTTPAATTAATTAENAASMPSSLIWTAGDSSLDNKYWFPTHMQAPSGAYRDLLHPPRSKCDVTFWMNKLAQEKKIPMATINTAGMFMLSFIASYPCHEYRLFV